MNTNRKFCINCSMNKWNQTEDTPSLKRCSKCYMVSYCGKECQEEHWKKVHKHHCKFGCSWGYSDHNEMSCTYCIAEKAAGKKVFRSKNPTYICTFADGLVDHYVRRDLPSFPHPFHVAGLPDDRCERLINAMQRVLLKIAVTNHPASQCWAREMKNIGARLWNLKRLLYDIRLTYPEFETPRTPAFAEETRLLVQEALECVFVEGYVSQFSDRFQLFDTFRLLCLLFMDNEILAGGKMLRGVGKYLTREHKKIWCRVGDCGAFRDLIDEVLDVLEHKLVPYRDLVAIACKGNIERECNTCGKQISVEMIVHSTDLVATQPSSVAVSAIDRETYTCGAPECMDKLVIANEYLLWFVTNGAICAKLENTRCDKCFIMAPLKEVHRSICLTKNYCSQACRSADEESHKICCGEGRVEERKVKVGGKEKGKIGNKRVDIFIKSQCAVSVASGYQRALKKISDKVKKEKPNEKVCRNERLSEVD